MAKKKKMTLGTLEKTMKKKTTTLKFWLKRRRPQPWSFGKKPRIRKTQLWELWKNHEEQDHNY
jgi:hypothetical protein